MCNCEDRPACGCALESGVSLFGVDPTEHEGEMTRPCGRCGEVDCECGDEDGEPRGSHDLSDDGDALASAGHGTDEDYGGEDRYLDASYEDRCECGD